MAKRRHPTHHGPSNAPSHTPGTQRGEEWIKRHGREHGRHDDPPHRTARDSTSLNAKKHGPIDPRMPHIPPA